MESHGKKIKVNIISITLCQIITIALGFILPRLYLENFGSAVNGVLSTIKQIFVYMTLCEAGIGLATMQALYGPVARGEKERINSILSATRRFYIRNGFIYIVIILLIGIIYGFFVDTGLPASTVLTLVVLNGLPTIFSFFVQSKYAILVETDGRQYIITNSQIALQIASGVGKIVVLMLTDSLVLMQLSYCVFAVLQLLCIVIYARRRYKWLDFSAEPDYSAISQKNSVLVHQISSMVFNNTDVILLSMLCGFKTVSIYSIYEMFFKQLELFIANILRGFSFSLGQLFSVDRERFDKLYRIYEMCYIGASFIIYTLMAVFLLPVIQLYTRGINDVNYTEPLLVLLFAVLKLLASVKLPSEQLVEYSGRFSETKSYAVIEVIINLSASVIGILLWGIYGALAGTVCALALRCFLSIRFGSREILGQSCRGTGTLLLTNGGVFALIMVIFGTESFSRMKLLPLLGRCAIHSVWITALYIAVNAVFHRAEMKQIIKWLREKACREKAGQMNG